MFDFAAANLYSYFTEPSTTDRNYGFGYPYNASSTTSGTYPRCSITASKTASSVSRALGMTFSIDCCDAGCSNTETPSNRDSSANGISRTRIWTNCNASPYWSCARGSTNCACPAGGPTVVTVPRYSTWSKDHFPYVTPVATRASGLRSCAAKYAGSLCECWCSRGNHRTKLRVRNRSCSNSPSTPASSNGTCSG